MKIISRREAAEKKQLHYYTGIPCQSGHLSERYTKSARCKECCRIEAKKRYDEFKKYFHD